MFSYVDFEARIPARHPLRVIREIVNDALASLDGEFEALYEGTGRQSIAPERLLLASLLQTFYSVRTERLLMEQINYNLLFRWFVSLCIDNAVWDHSTFSKNRDRLLDADVAAKFLEGPEAPINAPVGRRLRQKVLLALRLRQAAYRAGFGGVDEGLGRRPHTPEACGAIMRRRYYGGAVSAERYRRDLVFVRQPYQLPGRSDLEQPHRLVAGRGRQESAVCAERHEQDPVVVHQPVKIACRFTAMALFFQLAAVRLVAWRGQATEADECRTFGHQLSQRGRHDDGPIFHEDDFVECDQVVEVVRHNDHGCIKVLGAKRTKELRRRRRVQSARRLVEHEQ